MGTRWVHSARWVHDRCIMHDGCTMGAFCTMSARWVHCARWVHDGYILDNTHTRQRWPVHEAHPYTPPLPARTRAHSHTPLPYTRMQIHATAARPLHEHTHTRHRCPPVHEHTPPGLTGDPTSPDRPRITIRISHTSKQNVYETRQKVCITAEFCVYMLVCIVWPGVWCRRPKTCQISRRFYTL